MQNKNKLLNIKNNIFLWLQSLNPKYLQNKFTQAYKNNIWDCGSGSGSLEENTEEWRQCLENYIYEKNIKSMVDIGCGDWQSTKLVCFDGVQYLGIDIVDTVIAENIKKYSSQNIQFRVSDAIKDELTSADLVIIKEVLQHLSFSKIHKILAKLVNYKYALLVNDFCEENKDCLDGDYRPINLTKSPFNLKAKEILRYELRYNSYGEIKVVLLWENNV